MNRLLQCTCGGSDRTASSVKVGKYQRCRKNRTPVLRVTTYALKPPDANRSNRGRASRSDRDQDPDAGETDCSSCLARSFSSWARWSCGDTSRATNPPTTRKLTHTCIRSAHAFADMWFA